MAAATGPALLEGLRTELRREGVKLWLPPYTPAAGEEPRAAGGTTPLEGLAATYAARLGAGAETVAAALEELRLHAVEKLRAKSRVTLLARVAGIKGRGEAVRAEFDTASRGEDVRSELCRRLQALQLKAVAGGRSLQDGQSLGEQGWVCDVERQGQPLKVLLFPSGEAPPTGAGAADSAGQAPSTHHPEPEPRCSVAQIREAAEQLTAEGFGDFELSDAATGRLVPVPVAARQALIAAIALHSLGRDALYKQGEAEAVAGTAVEFLLEADRCFDRCREAGAGQLLEQIDNFGQLQLDICWAYAVLGDADHLPDAEKRLEATERLIRRRVDRNFLTLAEVKAEQGLVLPPDVLPSVRLWLLRGIARRCRGDVSGAREDLSRAATFMRALRVDDSAVTALLALGATREQAVAALRRCGGSVDRAAEELVAAEAQRRVASSQRKLQRELGQTEAGSYVDPDCLAQLESMGIERKAAIDALRKTDNDVSSAAEVAAKAEADRVAKTCETQGREVDELALASLLSLGFPQAGAEAALLATPNGADVEAALLTLTAAAATAGGNAAGNAAGSASPSTTDLAHPSTSPCTAEAAESEAEKACKAADAAAKAEVERAAKRAKKRAMDEAKDLIERELGSCLRRSGLEDDLAGAALLEEEALLQQHLSCLEEQ